MDRIVNSPEYSQQFGDWGAPGSGGVTFCAPANVSSTQNQTVYQTTSNSNLPGPSG